MKYRTWTAWFLLGWWLMACSSTRPLITRGLDTEERRAYIIQNGFGAGKEVRESFMAGFPCVGMSQELIFNLYGAPDRTTGDDEVWEYVDKQAGLVTGFKFQDKKVVEINGDPRGGLPPGQNAP